MVAQWIFTKFITLLWWLKHANVSTLRFDIFCRGSCGKSFYYPVQRARWVTIVPWVIVYGCSIDFYKIGDLAERLPKLAKLVPTLANTKKLNFFIFCLATLAKITFWVRTLAKIKLFEEIWYFKVELWQRLPKSNFWFGTLANRKVNMCSWFGTLANVKQSNWCWDTLAKNVI